VGEEGFEPSAHSLMFCVAVMNLKLIALTTFNLLNRWFHFWTPDAAGTLRISFEVVSFASPKSFRIYAIAGDTVVFLL
jgi:hypothetical protein